MASVVHQVVLTSKSRQDKVVIKKVVHDLVTVAGHKAGNLHLLGSLVITLYSTDEQNDYKYIKYGSIQTKGKQIKEKYEL